MFEKHKAEVAARELAERRATLTEMINVAQGLVRVDTPLILQGGELAICCLRGAGLFETRRGPGQWAGKSAGVSVPVGMGLRVRVGQTHGHYVEGAEEPTVIDTGSLTMSDRRVVFLGGRYTREWSFSKLLGIQHDAAGHQTAIQVSNRQKTSGFTYPGLDAGVIAGWLDLAIALSRGERPQAIADLTEQLREIAPPPPAPA